MNRQQVAKVRHPWAIAALRWLKCTAQPGQRLVGVSYAEYRRVLRKASADAGFTAQGLHFTPHCPRAGAATQGSLDGRSVQDLMDDGRWGNEQSLKVYLDVATATAARTLHLADAYKPLLREPRAVGPIFM